MAGIVSRSTPLFSKDHQHQRVYHKLFGRFLLVHRPTCLLREVRSRRPLLGEISVAKTPALTKTERCWYKHDSAQSKQWEIPFVRYDQEKMLEAMSCRYMTRDRRLSYKNGGNNVRGVSHAASQPCHLFQQSVSKKK